MIFYVDLVFIEILFYTISKKKSKCLKKLILNQSFYYFTQKRVFFSNNTYYTLEIFSVICYGSGATRGGVSGSRQRLSIHKVNNYLRY